MLGGEDWSNCSSHTESSQQSAALVDACVSAVSLPSGICPAPALSPPCVDGGGRNAIRPYRDLVTTHVYTVPPREGALMRLWSPSRPSTGRSNRRVRPRKENRARSAHVSRFLGRASADVTTSTKQASAHPPPLHDTQTASRKRQPQSAYKVEVSGDEKIIGRVIGGSAGGLKSHGPRFVLSRAPETAPASTVEGARRDWPHGSAWHQSFSTRWTDETPCRPSKARAMSAPGRRSAIRRVIDACCVDLPSLPELSRGAERFLAQWDRSSRAQRRRILSALTEQLLVHRAAARAPTDVSPRTALSRAKGSMVCTQQRRESPWEEMPVQCVSESPGPPASCDHCPITLEHSAATQRKGKACQRAKLAADVSFQAAHAGAEPVDAGDRAFADLDQADGAPEPSANFLQLLGPHATLLAPRIFSYLRTSFSGGHEISTCLRAAALLVEFNTDDSRENPCAAGSAIRREILQSFTSLEITRIALEVVAGEGGAGDDRALIPHAEAGGDSPAEALRLLASVARAGGEGVKEAFTCNVSDVGTSANRDVLGGVILALRSAECSNATRNMAYHLLVELGVGNPNGSAQLWTALLCLLEPEEADETHVLGCRVASSILSCWPGPSIPDAESLRAPLLASEGTMRKYLVLVPSLLRLVLSDCSGVRHAAGELATAFTTLPEPCCYLVVGGLVGFLGLLSGVDRGAPTGWIQPALFGSTAPASVGGYDQGFADDEHRGESQRSGNAGMSSESSSHPVHHKEHTAYLREGETSCGLEGRHHERSWRSTLCQGPDHTVQGSEATYVNGDREGARELPPVNRDAPPGIPSDHFCESIDDVCQGVRALSLLQRIILRNGADQRVRQVFVSTRAPLAVLDLVVLPLGAGESPSRNLEVGGDSISDAGNIFVTQKSGALSASPAHGITASGGHRCDTQMGHGRDFERQRHHLHEQCDSDCVGGSTGRREREEGGRQGVHTERCLCGAVARTLVALYRGGETSGSRPDGHVPVRSGDREKGERARGCPQPRAAGCRHRGQPQQDPIPREAIDCRGMIDAALAGCPHLYRSLYEGDTQRLARYLCQRAGADACTRWGGPEIPTLRANMHELTTSLGRCRVPSTSALHPLGDHASGRQGVTETNSPTSGTTACMGSVSVLASHSAGEGRKQPFSCTIAGRQSPCARDEARQADLLEAAKRQQEQRRRRRRHGGRCTSHAPRHHKRRRRHVAVTACSSSPHRANVNPSLSQEWQGPRVWGPEDWADDAPAMAMLTEPAARQRKPPALEQGERPGPIWRTVFGGGYDFMESSEETTAETDTNRAGDDNAQPIAQHCGRDDSGGGGHAQARTPTRSTRGYSATQKSAVGGRQAAPPKTQRCTPWGDSSASTTATATRHLGRHVAKTAPAAATKRVARLPMGAKYYTKGDIANKRADPTSSRGRGGVVRDGAGGMTIADGERGMRAAERAPVVQGAAIVMSAFEVAERYATTC